VSKREEADAESTAEEAAAEEAAAEETAAEEAAAEEASGGEVEEEATGTCSRLEAPIGLRVLSYNIRFDCQCDPDSFPAIFFENRDSEPWDKRASRVAEVIESLDADVVGLQETKFWQANALSCSLGFPWMGVGREAPKGDVRMLTASVVGVVLVAAVALYATCKALAAVGRGIAKVEAGKKSTELSRSEDGGAKTTRRTVLASYMAFHGYILVTTLLPPLSSIKTCSKHLTSFREGIVFVAATALAQSVFLALAYRVRVPLVCFALHTVLLGFLLSTTVLIPWLHADEYSPIMFNPSAVSFAGNYNTTWLSENQVPGEIATEWGAGCTRVATYGTFTKSGKDFNFINTHLDHVGDLARRGASHVITKSIVKDLTEKTGGFTPTVLTGDFNTYVGSPAWYELNSTLGDTFFLSEEPHTGPLKSYNAFADWVECGRSIDWIFATRDRFWVAKHESFFIEGRVSDHNPMLASLYFRDDGDEEGVCLALQKEDYRRPFSDCPPRPQGRQRRH
jgi:endonuclease/exonuclease/phosphatase family metal-dependent hydrolase